MRSATFVTSGTQKQESLCSGSEGAGVRRIDVYVPPTAPAVNVVVSQPTDGTQSPQSLYRAIVWPGVATTFHARGYVLEQARAGVNDGTGTAPSLLDSEDQVGQERGDRAVLNGDAQATVVTIWSTNGAAGVQVRYGFDRVNDTVNTIQPYSPPSGWQATLPPDPAPGAAVLDTQVTLPASLWSTSTALINAWRSDHEQRVGPWAWRLSNPTGTYGPPVHMICRVLGQVSSGAYAPFELVTLDVRPATTVLFSSRGQTVRVQETGHPPAVISGDLASLWGDDTVRWGQIGWEATPSVAAVEWELLHLPRFGG